MKWRPSRRKIQEYKDANVRAQLRDRQLQREHGRRTCQRIQNNPNSNIAKSLQNSMQRHNRQCTLDRATGKQLKPEKFAEYLSNIMSLGEPGTLSAREFSINSAQHTANVIREIKTMENNKAVRTDGIHV